MHLALETGDFAQIERTAHSLKSELAYLGLPNAAQKARDIEQMGHDHALQAAADLFPGFQAEISAGAAEMREALRDVPVDQ